MIFEMTLPKISADEEYVVKRNYVTTSPIVTVRYTFNRHHGDRSVIESVTLGISDRERPEKVRTFVVGKRDGEPNASSEEDLKKIAGLEEGIKDALKELPEHIKRAIDL